MKTHASALSFIKIVAMLETTTRGVLLKGVFLKILQNSEENAYARVSFFNKVIGLRKIPWHKCSPMNFTKLLRTSFLQNTSGQQPLQLHNFNFVVAFLKFTEKS